jgi:hypothetical protein
MEAKNIPLRKIHLYLGWLGVLAFVLSGQYMDHVISPAMEASDRFRFSIRGNHIYLLLVGLLHLCLGAYLRESFERSRVWLQRLGSVLLCLAAALVLAAFLWEPKDTLDRPVTLAGMIAAVAGTGLHLLAVRKLKE